MKTATSKPVYRHPARSHAPGCQCPRCTNLAPSHGNDTASCLGWLMILAVLVLAAIWPAFCWHGQTDTGAWRWDIHSTIAVASWLGGILAVAVLTVLARANSPEIREEEKRREEEGK